MPDPFLIILIPVVITLGASVSVGAAPSVSVTCTLALLENPAKSKATRSNVYVPFLNPVQVMVTCFVSEMLFVFPEGYSNNPTCCLSRRTKTLLIFFGQLIVYETVNWEFIAALEPGELRLTLMLASGLSSLPGHFCTGA